MLTGSLAREHGSDFTRYAKQQASAWRQLQEARADQNDSAFARHYQAQLYEENGLENALDNTDMFYFEDPLPAFALPVDPPTYNEFIDKTTINDAAIAQLYEAGYDQV